MQLEDDMFVMPSIPDNMEDGSIHMERRQRHRTATREPLLLDALEHNHIVGLPTGLELQDTMLMCVLHSTAAACLCGAVYGYHSLRVYALPFTNFHPAVALYPQAE